MEKIIMPEEPRRTTHTLPILHTPLVGREQMVEHICMLLCGPGVRLLTLTGTAGVGKTRLGVEVATKLTKEFADGVCFVPLEAIHKPELVIPTITRQLGVQEIRMQSIFEQVKVALQEKQILLVLDNFEQVVTAAAQVEELLIACSSLKVMVTSREVLHLQAEEVCVVSPLPLPDLNQVPECETLVQYPAVELFIQRAQAMLPTFEVTSTNAHVIAEICVRLDGLPLALELAAIRVRLLPPQKLLTRLSQRLQVLKQSLRTTIQWSYELLTAEEQRLFRRLSVFVGGFTVEAAEALVQLSDDEMQSGNVSALDRLESLLDKSLLQVGQEEEEPRLTMLETIREYGLERLQESGEAPVCQRAHASYYLAFALEAASHLRGGQQVFWWKRLERERENLRAALTWSIGQGEGELALRLCGALWWFWNQRSYWSEGRRWLEETLGLPQAQGKTVARANVLLGAAELTYRLGVGSSVAGSYAQECESIYRELADKRGLALLLSGLGLALFVENGIAAARPRLEESLALAREVRDRWVLAYSLQNFGDVMCRNGNFEDAYRYLEESVRLYRELQDKQSLSRRLLELGWVSPVAKAAVLAQESLALARELGNEPDIARALYASAMIHAWQDPTDHIGQVVTLLEESLALFREQGDMLYIGITLLTLGGIVLHQGDLLRAETCVQESLTFFGKVGGPYRMALAQRLLGDVRLMQRDCVQARIAYKEGASLAGETGNRFVMGRNLIGLARVAVAEGQFEQAACLFGAAELCFNPRGHFYSDMDPFECADYERLVEGVRRQLGKEAFTAAWDKGQNMTLEQALAMESVPLSKPVPIVLTAMPVAPAPTHAGLTPREMDVLRLLAQGLRSAQIAERLFIEVSTVNDHVSSIYGKLGVNTRGAVARYAIEHGLV
jgi:predicted ATPase/DNA-binding CsgD family transcriptional regulator